MGAYTTQNKKSSVIKSGKTFKSSTKIPNGITPNAITTQTATLKKKTRKFSNRCITIILGENKYPKFELIIAPKKNITALPIMQNQGAI